MNENLLQFAWQCKLFKSNIMHTTDGLRVEIIDVGQPNKDAGPDFFNAKIKLEDTIWAGNVEIHTLASDWYRHHHDIDKLYDTIILHVVWKSDLNIRRSSGELIPQVELQLMDEVEDRFNSMHQSNGWIRCGALWQDVDSAFARFQLSRMVNERLYRKAEDVGKILAMNTNNWSETFYQVLLKSFGMHTNSLPFESLGKSLPLKCIAKKKDDILAVEAMLFGQAGLLSEKSIDTYERSLYQQYQFLSKMFSLKAIDTTLWKFGKMRPVNFPHVKIAQFASLAQKSNHLFSQIIRCKDLTEIQSHFDCTPSDYWHTHYRFGTVSPFSEKRITKTSINTLIINAVVPLKFAYAIKNENDEMQDDCFSLLEQIPKEDNKIVRGWEELGLRVTNAYESQALVELKTQYCDVNKCLRCNIGHHLLSQK